MAALLALGTGFRPHDPLEARPPCAVRADDPVLCPSSGSTLSDRASDAWQRPASKLAEHRALRARLGAATPEAPTMLFVYTEAAHHVTESYSTVATRGGDGGWRLDTVGEESSALLTIEPKALPAGAWAAFVPFELAWAHEAAEAPAGHPRYREVASLGELARWVEMLQGGA